MSGWRETLSWIQRNRTRRTRTQRLGNIVRCWAGGLESSGGGQIESAVDEIVDDEFRRVCCVRGVQRRCLIIGVREPSLVNWMARRWQTGILAALTRHESVRGINSVRFEFDGSTAMGVYGGRG